MPFPQEGTFCEGRVLSLAPFDGKVWQETGT